MHILGVWLFQNFVRKKSDPTNGRVTFFGWSNHIFKTQWEIHFFKRHFSRKKAPKKIYNSNYIGLCAKNSFRNNFGPREVPQQENA